MFAGVDAMYASIGGRDHIRAMARFDEAQAAGLSDSDVAANPRHAAGRRESSRGIHCGASRTGRCSTPTISCWST